jgi:ribosomal-protein-serine acetyltransferase
LLIPATLPIAADTHLRPYALSDADELIALITANLDHLKPWMGWAHGYDPVTTHDHVRRGAAQEHGAQFVIVRAGHIAGTIGFHAFDWMNRSTSIGYWIAAADQGHGVVTGAVRALSRLAFDDWGVHRIQLRAAPHNARSRAVAERCGFEPEGIARGAELIGGRYRDLVVYALLSS